jgi:hypothetical protein
VGRSGKGIDVGCLGDTRERRLDWAQIREGAQAVEGSFQRPGTRAATQSWEFGRPGPTSASGIDMKEVADYSYGPYCHRHRDLFVIGSHTGPYDASRYQVSVLEDLNSSAGVFRKLTKPASRSIAQLDTLVALFPPSLTHVFPLLNTLGSACFLAFRYTMTFLMTCSKVRGPSCSHVMVPSMIRVVVVCPAFLSEGMTK